MISDKTVSYVLTVLFDHIGGLQLLLACLEERTMKSRTIGTHTLERGFFEWELTQ